MRFPIRPFAMLVVLVGATTVLAQDAKQPPPELKILGGMVGVWEEVMTNKPTELMPTAGKSTSVTKKAWSLDNRFVRMEGVWEPAKTQFLSLATYDPISKEYRNWYFDSAGIMPRGTLHGAWDDAAKTITWTGEDEFGNKSRGVTKFVDEDTHEWTLVMTDPNGKVIIDVQARNTRRKS